MHMLRSHWLSAIWLTLVLALAGCGGGGGGGGVGGKGEPGPEEPPAPAALLGIEVTSDAPSLPKGVSRQFSATGLYADSTTRDLTDEVAWASDDPTIASVDPAGLVRAESIGGPVAIRATLDDVTGAAELTVSDAVLTALDVTPPSASVPAGMTQPFVATGTYSDGTTLDISDQVQWASSDDAVATVDADGLATAKVAHPGVTVSATLDAFGDAAILTVTSATLQSIEVTASSDSVPAGFEQDYTATGRCSDGSTRALTGSADWSSSDENVARVDGGTVRAVRKGTATIRAAVGGVSGSHGVAVTDAVLQTLVVGAPDTSLASGYAQQYSAQGTYSDGSTRDLTAQVAWSVSDESLARVSNEAASKGRVTALAAGGPIDVIAISGAVSAAAQLTVTAAVLTAIEIAAPGDTLSAGAQQQYSATGVFSDGSALDLTQVVTWESSDDAIAEISNAAGSRGRVTAMSAGGPVTISATYDPGTGAIGDARPLTVSAAHLVSIVVTSDSGTLYEGLSQQYTATGLYSDHSESDLTAFATWSVVPGEDGIVVATVSNADGTRGLLTATAVGGPAQITATLDGVSAGTPLTVDDATLVSLVLQPMAHALPLGLKVQYTAVGTYSDETELDLTANVTWTSSLPGVASISNLEGTQGLASAVSVGGPTTITATLDGVSASTTLSVTQATLRSLVVSPADLNLPRGVSQQYVATATFSDDSVQDVTREVHWTTSDATIATISNAEGSQGLARTLASGSPITIGATLSAFGAASASTTLTVNERTLAGIEVRPAETTCGRGKQKQFRAFALYDNGSDQELTAQMRWTSSATRLVTVGLATGLAKTTGNPKRTGDATISARLLGLNATAVVHKLANKTACTP